MASKAGTSGSGKKAAPRAGGERSAERKASGRSPRMERKQEEARRRILDAARALFLSESGYEKATVRDIAEEADVSVGGVYLHFRSKPEILAALIQNHLTKVDRYFGEIQELEGLEATGAEKFLLFLEKFEQLATPEEKDSQLMVQLLSRLGSGLDQAIGDMLVPHAKHIIDILCSILTLGGKDGSLSPIITKKPRKAAIVIFQSLEGLAVFNFGAHGMDRFRDELHFGYSPGEIYSTFADFFVTDMKRRRRRKK